MPKARVLVVDDEPLIRWSVGERMRAEGYDVAEADTGSAALRQFERGSDVVLLDSRLPDAAGAAVLSDLLDRDPDVPVILMTADAGFTQSAAEVLNPKDLQIAAKPFLLDDLVAMVRGALDRRHRREASARPPAIPA